MPAHDSTGFSRSAAFLLFLVAAVILAPLGAFITSVVAQTMGGSSPPRVLVSPDPISDEVSATAAEFRVDESGAATYTVPLYTLPGTAGVVPELSLSYSSQAGDGALGKGWGIGGLSSITRCRATREAGDFIGAATPDGNPRPVNFTASDRFCLDGQRLIPASTACPAVGGATSAALATEVDSFKRVCAYTANANLGPAFFTVESKDGAISYYGDRDNATSSNRPDGYVDATSPLKPGAAIAWAQTRFQDSTGNYIDYLYTENPAGAGTGEHVIREVRYTGKVVLSGQSGGAQAPYAKVQFNYNTRPTARWSRGFLAGGAITTTQRLDSITTCATAGSGCISTDQARHVLLTYGTSVSGSGFDTLIGLQECRDSTAAVCSAPTSFLWTTGVNEFSTYEKPATLPITTAYFKNFKLGDINGDGRQDFVYLRNGSANCATSFLVPMLSTLDAAGTPTFLTSAHLCLSANLNDRGDGAWHLFDYNGDGRDDLFVSTGNGEAWRLHPSNGSGFDTAQNLIAGISPAIPSNTNKNLQVQTADLNGDGLIDVIYPAGGGMRARLMERQGATFAFGAEKALTIDESTIGWAFGHYCTQSNYECSYEIAGMPTKANGFSQLADFNGDAASDLMIEITEIYKSPDVCQNPGDDWCLVAAVPRVHAFAVTAASSSAMTLSSYGSIDVMLEGSQQPQGGLSLADANGDGLTDVFHRSVGPSDWKVSINTGAGFQAAVSLSLPNFKEQTRFADANGDGRADLLYLIDNGAFKAYGIRPALPGGGFAASGSFLLGGGNARLCEGSSCNVQQHVPVFADMDADGNLDFMSLSMAESSPTLLVSRAGQRFVPRDVISRVVNGLGLETDLTYAPLTNSAVYRRDTGSRNNANWGRGSPVLDMVMPTYVVARAASSSPSADNPAAKATVHYRYAGAKVQAGGRGFLGFREIATVDPNQSGGYVATTTSYAQNFPFVGVPVQTVKAAILNQTYIVPSCLNGIMNDSCFATPGQGFADLGGSWFSNHLQSWEFAPNSLASQTTLHVRPMGTEESLRDPYTGAQTSKVATAFSYGTHGNVTQTVVDTYTDASTLTSTLITSNTYGDDVARWRLGRLTASTITHRRPGLPDVVRTTGFSYAMAGAATGLMTEERTQPGGAANLASTTSYTLDAYGNRTQSTTCAAPATDCSTSGFQFHPAAPNAVKRYSRVEYDAQGRFPVATYEPFWTTTGGEERQTTRVLQRNLFGDPTEVLDVNYVRTYAFKGLLGRDYYSWAQTAPGVSPGSGGASSITTFRWCDTGANTVACPTGAKYRQQIVATGAPRQWSYFDALGRPVLKAVESFNGNVSGQDVSAVCTGYDVTGRAIRASTPFFLPGTSGVDGPTGVAGVCTAGERLWTTTSYDVLGRPTVATAPDSSQAITSYSGLSTTTHDQRNNPTTQTRNGKGELISTVDAAGFQTTFAYTADGNLRTVTRNAGAGAIANSFVYDTLGRKTQQTDPDTGTTLFEYNALGEPIAQTDNGGFRVEQELDARGRVWRKTAKLANGTVESQSTFEFDTAGNGSGQLTYETITGTYAEWAGQVGTELNYTRHYAYDLLGRPVGTTTVIDGQYYPTAVEYDSLGRPWRSQDATGLWTKTQYSNRGAVAVCASDYGDTTPACATGSGTYQRTLATDAWGNVVKEMRGDSAAMEIVRQYHAQTGRIAQICAGNTACNLVKEAYGWDAAGNLSSHQKEGRYLETFTYDSLNRLTEGRLAWVNGTPVNQVALANAYDALGNICSKNGQGYAYPGADGCVGAVAMASSSAEAETPLTPYLRPNTQRYSASFAFNRGVMGAPDYRYRRYSDDDRPSWDRDDEEWSLEDDSTLEPGEGIWVRRVGSRGAQRATQLTSTEAVAPAPQPDPSVMAMASVANSPHAVNQIGQSTAASFYYYDDRGNQNLRDAPGTASDRTIRYSADNKAHEIVMGNGQRVRFWYGPDGQRYKREDAGKITLYLGGVEVAIQGSLVTAKRYVAGIALQTVVSGVLQTTQFLFHDHLGSLVRIANVDGSVAEGLDYSAFGARRSYSDPNATGNASTTTTRGFTGHEYVDGTGIIHMNGRIYDQELGRFLQPDPIIQEPNNAQSWNAYTYVFNNPLAYTDPTGNITFRQIAGMVIMVVGIFFVRGMDGGALAKIGAAMVFGFASGYVATGTFRGGVTGAFTAGITMGIGQLGLSLWGQVAFQAWTGGVVESINGGQFGHGFAAAGLTTAFMPQVGNITNDLARTTVGALVGGTISEATGGKFANGAISGAIQGGMARQSQPHAVNQANSDSTPNQQLAKETLSAVEEAMFRDKAFRSYASELKAHEAFQGAVRSVAPEAEVGVKIGTKGGRYYLGAPYSIGAPGSVSGIFEHGHLSSGVRLTAISHYHPGGNSFLSGTGVAYRYGSFDADATVYQAWNRTGDGRSAYNEGINIYSFSDTDYDYFNYESYRSLQQQKGGSVPLCFSTRLGCP